MVALLGCEAPGPAAGERQAEGDGPVAPGAVPLADAESADALRRRGRAGFAELRQRWIDAGRPDSPAWTRLLDAVAQQRDAGVSGLFWETDLEAALAEARVRQVPVLSLRMLGDLTDEHSCANSRFFRAVLYSDPELSAWLDQHFVLHWSSERPVPQVTIDFGDGRTIHTTTTGNSVHYVLDSRGPPLDVVPGLYGPKAFRDALEQSLRLFDAVRRAPDGERADRIRAHHRAAIAKAKSDLQEALADTPLSLSGLAQEWITEPARQFDADAMARRAGIMAMTKSSGEFQLYDGGVLPQEMDASLTGTDTLRRRDLLAIAAPVKLHDAAMDLIRRDRPRRRDETSTQYEQRIADLRKRFEESIAIDTVINEYKLRVAIRGWFSRDEAPPTFEAFNDRVYSEVFLTPRDDPWLGLVDDRTYDGLVEAGIASLPG